MAETKVDRKERKKLKIISVNELVKKGQYLEILAFKCDDNLVYQTTKKHLFPYIKIDTEIDADTQEEIVTFDDGGQMTKWVVTELYKDGKPISPPEAKGQRYGNRSSDASIESQVAFKGMVELMVADKIKPESKEGKATIEWAMSRLHSVTQLKAQIEKALEVVESMAEVKSTAAAVRDATKPESEIKTAGQLLQWIMSKDINIKAPRVWLNTNFGVDLKAILTIEKIKEIYEAVKSDMGW